MKKILKKIFKVIKTIFEIITLQYVVEIKQPQQYHYVSKEYVDYVEKQRREMNK